MSVINEDVALGKMELNEFQIKAATALWEEAGFTTVGMMFDVGESEERVSHIYIREEFLDELGKLSPMSTCKSLSLRKSLEQSFMNHLQHGPHWSSIQRDNRETPRYLLHGWTAPWDATTTEVWTAHASMGAWASLYSWTGQLPVGYPCSIELNDCSDVLGYIYLFEVSNPDFYSDDSRMQNFVCDGSPHAPDHTAETAGRIFARHGYGTAQPIIGDTLLAHCVDPDAYIFKGTVVKDACLKVLHTYRIIKPSVSEEKRHAIQRHIEEEERHSEEEVTRAEVEAEELQREAERRQLNPCGCKYASNVYHTCVDFCECRCTRPT